MDYSILVFYVLVFGTYFDEILKRIVMAKPTAYTPDIKDKASEIFNQKLQELKNVKEPDEVKDRIFSLVDRVLAK